MVDVLCLAETWHDVGGVAFNRLQAANYQVVDRPRPRSAESADLSTNHGGVAVIAAPGINLSLVNVAVDDPSTFEYVCARISTGQYSAIVFVIYRPGSSAVQPVFSTSCHLPSTSWQHFRKQCTWLVISIYVWNVVMTRTPSSL